VSAAELNVHLPSRCWSNRSPKDRLHQACFPVFSTVYLELAAANSPEQTLISAAGYALKQKKLRLSVLRSQAKFADPNRKKRTGRLVD